MGAARSQVAIVVDAIDRIVRAVTNGDIVRLGSENGARGEWLAVEHMLERSRL
jgi:hypothetical protein